MKSGSVGKGTLDVEITNIDMQGVWLLTDDKEFFLPFERFPWFRGATVGQIHNVELVNGDQIRWPDLDKKLSVASIGHGELIPTT